jgi:putative ABC transport system permease protein
VALLWSLHGQGQAELTEQVPLWLVQPRSVADAYRLRQTWRRDGVMAVFPAEVLAELLGQLGDARQVLGWVAAGTQGLVLCAGLLTVAVLLATRRQAHAVLRALGAPRAYLLAMNWLLAMGVGWRACVLALPMALAMAWAAAGAVQRSTGLLVHITPQWADLALPATLLAASALGATVLAWQACSRPVMGELNS